jgi:hypothetical protein
VSAVGRRNCSDPEAIAPFGSLESLYRLDTTTGPSRFDHSTNLACSVFARMEYTAGVVTCLNCRLSAGGIIKTTLEAESIEPDPLAEQASRMMPNVLALMSTSHSWQTWMRLGKLDTYTKGMLSVAYQASWNSMANYWTDDTTMRQTAPSRAFPALIASITVWRV